MNGQQQRGRTGGLPVRGQKLVTDVPEFEDGNGEELEIPEEAGDPQDTKTPRLVLTLEEKKELYRSVKNALVVKLMGKTLGFRAMAERLERLWAIKGHFSLVDVGHGFFVVKFAKREDYDFALSGGPWIIADHCLAVRRYDPFFRAETTKISKMVIWVRFPGLPVSFFCPSLLTKLGDMIGKTVKIDTPTKERSRGHFARVAIEVDLDKPLVPRLLIKEGFYQHIEYEGIHMICFHCGTFGHRKEACPKLLREQNEDASGGIEEGESSRGREEGRPIPPAWDPSIEFGEWMVVQRKPRRRGGSGMPRDEGARTEREMRPPRPYVDKGKEKITPQEANMGSRFNVLDREEGTLVDELSQLELQREQLCFKMGDSELEKTRGREGRSRGGQRGRKLAEGTKGGEQSGQKQKASTERKDAPNGVTSGEPKHVTAPRTDFEVIKHFRPSDVQVIGDDVNMGDATTSLHGNGEGVVPNSCSFIADDRGKQPEPPDTQPACVEERPLEENDLDMEIVGQTPLELQGMPNMECDH